MSCTPPRRRRVAALCASAGALLACALGCGPAHEPAADAGWPPGALLSARTEALGPLLAELEGLGGTPLARQAARLRRALPHCAEVEAAAPTPEQWPDALRCADATPRLPGLRAHRNGALAAFALPLRSGAPRLLLRTRRDESGLRLDLRWPDPAPALAALLPGSEPSGAAVLSPSERLFHVRVRADGPLDLAALVPEGSQADQLFRLRTELLSAAILDGTWEAAIYAPEPGAGSPRVALALGVRQPSAAAAAAARLLDDVERHWPVSRTPLASDDPGACLLGLRVLPDLAPCYQATRRALVLAWNPASLRHALGPETVAEPDTAPGALELDLTGLRRADLALAERVGPAAVAAVARWPWRHLRARGERAEDAWTFRVDLDTAGRGGPER